MINAALEESRQWGRPRPVISEYKTYSESHVKVYKDDQLISSTDNGVRRCCSKYLLTYCYLTSRRRPIEFCVYSEVRKQKKAVWNSTLSWQCNSWNIFGVERLTSKRGQCDLFSSPSIRFPFPLFQDCSMLQNYRTLRLVSTITLPYVVLEPYCQCREK